MKNGQLTLGSLFSGIGGFELGFERTGKIKTIWQVEIDDYCRRVLSRHWPSVQRFKDIRECCGHRSCDDEFCGKGFNLPYADILCGGFPCQDISNAGKRAGIDGKRSGMWSEYARIVRELRPRYVVVENVAALLFRRMERVLGDLAACGYDAEWQSIRASDIGAPHRRERIWIVAFPNRSEFRRIRCDGVSEGQQYRERRETFRFFDTLRSDVADTNGGRFAVQGEPSGYSGFVACGSETLADTERAERRTLSEERDVPNGHDAGWEETASGIRECREDVSDAASREQRSIGAQCDERRFQNETLRGFRHSHDWSTEPDVGRVAHGIPARVDRLRGLGNAIVPQIAEFLAQQILAFESRVTSHEPLVTASFSPTFPAQRKESQ
jgi:DNA (cytosine-5)-methyltransferase 1